jgi:hypothetical protein
LQPPPSTSTFTSMSACFFSAGECESGDPPFRQGRQTNRFVAQYQHRAGAPLRSVCCKAKAGVHEEVEAGSRSRTVTQHGMVKEWVIVGTTATTMALVVSSRASCYSNNRQPLGQSSLEWWIKRAAQHNYSRSR